MVPEAGGGVLPTNDGIEVFAKQVDDFATARMVGRKHVEEFDKSHREPSLGTSPTMLAESCLRVSPKHLAGLVPCVAIQARGGVEGALIGGENLMDGIVIHLLSLFLG